MKDYKENMKDFCNKGNCINCPHLSTEKDYSLVDYLNRIEAERIISDLIPYLGHYTTLTPYTILVDKEYITVGFVEKYWGLVITKDSLPQPFKDIPMGYYYA